MSIKDFFVSYNGKDKEWAEWLAWQLEEAGYTTVIQAWDFRPGGNFVIDMQLAAEQAERTIAVLSQNYLDAMYTQPEWAAAFAQDPTGRQKTLLPVRVQECNLKGMLSQIVYIDLMDKPEDEARKLLLAGLNTGRAKPTTAPGFPTSGRKPISHPQTEKPVFPLESEWAEQNLPAASIRKTQIGGVNFDNVSGSPITIGNISANVSAGGDIVGGDKITTTTPTDSNSPEAQLEAALTQWRQELQTIISRLDDEDDREYVEKIANKMVAEAQKGQAADLGKVEGFLDKMSRMVPDILEVTATILQNPFKGVGLVLNKINDRIKLERR